jgi:hypothetical protein
MATWGAILSDGVDLYFHKLVSGVLQKQTFPHAVVDTDNTARTDVLWNETHLFVLLCKGTAPSGSEKCNSPLSLSKYTYDLHEQPKGPVSLLQLQLLNPGKLDNQRHRSSSRRQSKLHLGLAEALCPALLGRGNNLDNDQVYVATDDERSRVCPGECCGPLGSAVGSGLAAAPPVEPQRLLA